MHVEERLAGRVTVGLMGQQHQPGHRTGSLEGGIVSLTLYREGPLVVVSHAVYQQKGILNLGGMGEG